MNKHLIHVCLGAAFFSQAVFPDPAVSAGERGELFADKKSVVIELGGSNKSGDLMPGLRRLADMLSSDAMAASDYDRPMPVRADDVVASPQNLRSPVNQGGPETWPESKGLSTEIPAGAPASAPVPSLAPPAPVAPAAPFTPPTPEFGVPRAVPVDSTGPAPALERKPAAPASPARQAVTPSAPAPTPAVQKPAPAAPAAPAARKPVSPPSFAAPVSSPVETKTQVSAPLPTDPTSFRQTVPQKPSISSNATRPVIYVNEQGQQVPKPLEPAKMIAEAEKLMDGGQNQEAMEILKQVKELNLEKEVREHVLYLISDAMQAIYATKPLEGYEPMVSAASEAMSANLMSSRVPEALFRIGTANLKVGNLIEAEAYYKVLMRRFPNNPEVATAFYMLGKALLEKGDGARAAEFLRYILQNYPESKVLREASIALALALHNSGDYKQTEVIIEFIGKRWPRYYIDDPNLLLVEADLKLRKNSLEDALQTFWLYYNLKPDRQGNDKIMLKMGDLYLQQKKQQAADEMFGEIIKRFPDTSTALTAALRLSERGIHEGKFSIEEMFAVFKRNGTPPPPVVYRKMIKADPDGAYGREAALKMCMWELWKQENIDALAHAAEFIDNFPESPNAPEAREIIWRAFSADLKNSLIEENYGRILILWNGFPLIRERYGAMDDTMRMVLAKGYLERGEKNKAFEYLWEFIKPVKNAKYSDFAFTLVFNDLLAKRDWNGILNLGEITKNWSFGPEMRHQFDYAMALSGENLGLPDFALPIWRKLLPQENIPTYERAYAAYFLSKDAERRRDIKDSYRYNTQALQFFNTLKDERSEYANPDRVKETVASLLDITEVANRIPESLDWLEKYKGLISEDSPETPGIIFREARLYRKLGDTNKAKALLEIVSNKSPDSPFGKAAKVELSTFDVSRDLNNLSGK